MKTSRIGLYIIIIIILLYTCDINERTYRTEKKIDKLIERLTP